MLSSHARTVLLLAALLTSVTASYSFVTAEDRSAPAPNEMSGTFLVYTIDGSNHIKALVDPSVVDIGGKQFLTGRLSGRIGDLWAGSAFSGSRVFIAVDAITVMQELKSK